MPVGRMHERSTVGVWERPQGRGSERRGEGFYAVLETIAVAVQLPGCGRDVVNRSSSAPDQAVQSFERSRSTCVEGQIRGGPALTPATRTPLGPTDLEQQLGDRSWINGTVASSSVDDQSGPAWRSCLPAHAAGASDDSPGRRAVRFYQRGGGREVPRCPETDAGPAEPGKKRENTGSIRPMNNADRWDAASVECSGTFATDCHVLSRVRRMAVPHALATRP